jgi:hypothetical protein
MDRSPDTNGRARERADQLKVILLATQPGMLREMLHRVLEKDPAMRLVLETDSIRQIPRILDRIQADWLIATLTDDDRLPASVQSALERNPQVAVIGLSAEGDYAEVYEPQKPNGDRLRRRYSLDNISLHDLLKILGDE